MNEIKHIHLGRQQFTISLEAYGELKKYLDAITRQAGDVGADMTEEVESRMAELLTERGCTGEKVVLPKDVTFLKSQLGEPRDFVDDDLERDDKVEMNSDTSKRLFRDTDDAMIAGVAAGLGKYMGIDTIIMRLIFIALALFGGSGILLYVILWLLVPEAKTNTDRLQMDGLAVNIDNIKRAVDQADVPGATRRAGKVVGRIITVCVRIVLYMTGITLILAGVSMLLGDVTALVYGSIRGLQVAGITLFPVGSEQVAILVCAFVIVGLLAGMLIASGMSLIRKKWIMPGWAIAAVVGMFILASAVGSGFGVDVSPSIQRQYQQLHHTHAISVAPFKKLNFIGSQSFYITQPGPTNEVLIKTLGKVDTSKVKVSEKDGVLTVDTRSLDDAKGCNLICPYGPTNMEIIIQTPDEGITGSTTVYTPPAVPTLSTFYGSGR